jgi:hypothetical protein
MRTRPPSSSPRCPARIPILAPSSANSYYPRSDALSLLFNLSGLRRVCWFGFVWRFCRRRGGWPGGGSSSRAGGRGLVCRVSARWPDRAGSGGCYGPAADPGWGQAAGRAGPLPGRPQISGEMAGEVQLGVAGDDEPGPPVGGGRVAEPGAGPASGRGGPATAAAGPASGAAGGQAQARAFP